MFYCHLLTLLFPNPKPCKGEILQNVLMLISLISIITTATEALKKTPKSITYLIHDWVILLEFSNMMALNKLKFKSYLLI